MGWLDRFGSGERDGGESGGRQEGRIRASKKGGEEEEEVVEKWRGTRQARGQKNSSGESSNAENGRRRGRRGGGGQKQAQRNRSKSKVDEEECRKGACESSCSWSKCTCVGSWLCHEK